MRGQRGSAGVLLLAVGGLALLLVSGVGVVGALLVARTEAVAAADAAALAAAPVTFRPFGAEGSPRQEAARFAALNDARLVQCACSHDPSWAARTVEVTVERQVDLGPLGRVRVRGSSRAEFTPALLIGG